MKHKVLLVCVWFYDGLISAWQSVNSSSQETLYPRGVFWWLFSSWVFSDGSWWGVFCLMCWAGGDGRCSLPGCFQASWTSTVIYFLLSNKKFNKCGGEGAPILRSSSSELFFNLSSYGIVATYANYSDSLSVGSSHQHSSIVSVWTTSQLDQPKKGWRGVFESHLSAHVFHPGQCQLSQVSVLHSGAHQRHGDVPERRDRSGEKRREETDETWNDI